MLLQFNAAQVQPQQPFEPVPANWYPVVLKSCEPKETKAKDGSWFLNCEFEIIDGQFKGRKLFTMLNIGNTKSQQAVEIAYRELSAICHVTGRFVINDTTELLNIPFQLKASVEGSRNNVDGYKDVQGNDPGKASAPSTVPAAVMPPAAAPAAAQPAWGQHAAPAPAPVAAAPAWSGASAPAAVAPAPAPAWQPSAPAAAGATGGPPPWARS